MSNSTDQMLILPKVKRRRSNETEIVDRISDLPDCILLHILSSVNAKSAVRTCILSTRWKNLWKRLPSLLLHDTDFSNTMRFSTFVSTLLARRDDSIALHALDVCYIEPQLLGKVMSYAISHSVQQLGLAVSCDVHHIPQPCMFSSSLTSLSLLVETKGSGKRTVFPDSLNLPALTTLHLNYYAFCASDHGIAEPFSVFTSLKSLVIKNCNLSDAKILRVSSETLDDLTVLSDYCKELYTIELNAPSLHTFVFRGIPGQKLCGINISSLEQVNIDAEIWFHGQANFDSVIGYLGQAHFDAAICSLGQGNFDADVCWSMPSFVLLSWLGELSNIKSLTVSSSTLQVLFLIPHLLKLKVPILGSLKSLKVKHKSLADKFFMILAEAKSRKLPAKLRKPAKSRKAAATKVRNAAAAMLQETSKEGLSSSIPDGMVEFLLQNSPAAKVDIVRFTG